PMSLTGRRLLPRGSQMTTKGAPPLFHRRKAGRNQEGVLDPRVDWAVLLGFGALCDPFGIGLERVPFLLALGERFPLQHIGEVLVRVADQRRPEPRLLDAVA